MTITKEDAIAVMKDIHDPELGLDIYALGLIYDIQIKEHDIVYVKFTLTSPMCPFGTQIITEMRDGLLAKGFKEPELDITFDPPWQPSDEVKMMLGLL